MSEENKNSNDLSTPPRRRQGAGSAKIIMAGGGTGGHIFPAIAIANAIKKLAPGSEVLFVGAKGKMEMEKVPSAGYKIQGLDIAGFNRSSLIKNIALPYKLVKSFFQVRQIFKEFKPVSGTAFCAIKRNKNFYTRGQFLRRQKQYTTRKKCN
jgi:UDP-N-acetylglucosamine--N-acetylmuramyl-(pentapeptide) pyrophosphoryl-undecaprenol N-acetylglucosamine transferase